MFLPRERRRHNSCIAKRRCSSRTRNSLADSAWFFFLFSPSLPLPLSPTLFPPHPLPAATTGRKFVHCATRGVLSVRGSLARTVTSCASPTWRLLPPHHPPCHRRRTTFPVLPSLSALSIARRRCAVCTRHRFADWKLSMTTARL